MSYLYSQSNRMEEPHSYMYTQFEGEAFLRAYQSSRMGVICRPEAVGHDGVEPDSLLLNYAWSALEKLFGANSDDVTEKFLVLVNGASAKTFGQSRDTQRLVGLAKIDGFAVTKSINTLDLLHALIAVQITNAPDSNTKLWLDRLVQRYEVTKKLYEIYPPGFRKGEGVNTSVRLYWLFALALSLFYVRTNAVKYLSTLLKLCDLLCSLPEDVVQGHLPQHGLLLVLATEILSVQLQAEKKGISYEFK